MRKTLFAGLLLLLVVSLTGMSSCAKSAATSAGTSTPLTSGFKPDSTTQSPTTSSVSTGFDWSTVPVYPGSMRATSSEELRGFGELQRLYTIDIAKGSKVIDYYHSELPKNGWNITMYVTGNNAIWATKGRTTISIAVGTSTADQTLDEIDFAIMPSS